jgi:CrcB protein
MRLLLVGVAGAAGALSRYGIGLVIGPRTFPWATLMINITGSFLLGVVLTVATTRHWSLDVSTPIAVGFLGAYTTFSTFAWEGLTLGRTDRMPAAIGYVAVSVALGLLAAAAGLRVGTAISN